MTFGAPDKAPNRHHPDQKVDDWQVSLQFLKEGNQRFLSNQTMICDTHEKDRSILKDGQNPFAVILTCSDSRVSPEIYFDQKLGDIFVIRNAGNIADATALGSIEYAVGHLKVPLVVVAGHSQCGAVTTAFHQIKEMGERESNFSNSHPVHLQSILNSIRSEIKDANNLDKALDDTIQESVKRIRDNKTVQTFQANVLGAKYDIETGEVIWLP